MNCNLHIENSPPSIMCRHTAKNTYTKKLITKQTKRSIQYILPIYFGRNVRYDSRRSEDTDEKKRHVNTP